MNSRLFLAFLPLLLWQCATPRLPEPPRLGPDDDHRLVSKEEFQNSAWTDLPALESWKAEPAGVSLLLKDGRSLRLEFVTPSVLRWWVPASAGELPLSPAAFYPPSTTAVVKEVEGSVTIATPSLSVRLKLADLTWTLVRGDKVVLNSVPPQRAGRRLQQAFQADTTRWVGPGLSADNVSTKYWVGEKGTLFAAPVLVGVGGPLPFTLVLDNSYQTYSRTTTAQASLGALNGGLDILVSAAAQSAAVAESLSALTGRASLPPLWAHGTALQFSDSETGALLRRAKLPIEASVGSPPTTRQLFQPLSAVPSGELLPDLSSPETRGTWAAHRGVDTLPSGAGLILGPVPARTDWDARFSDTAAPLARMNNRLPQLEALAVTEAWQARNPGLRPWVLASSGGMGSIRQALPVLRLVAGKDSDALARALAWGASGLGTPAVTLDLTPLASDSRTAAYQTLLTWLLNPYLTLDWGSDPAAFWTALPDSDKIRLKAILDRRSQLKPLFAQLARQASLTGRPVWQPLWWSFPADPQADRDDEFLLGDLLAAPVTGKSRQVYLPGPGVWFDYWTGDEYGGGRTYELEAKPDKPLLFARGGAIIPSREAETFDDRAVYRSLTFHVFPGGRGMGTYLLDDGRNLGTGAWETKVLFDFSQKDMSLEQVSMATTGAVKPDPYVLYRIHNVFRPRQVKVDGKAVTIYGDSWGITDTDRSAAWYESDHTLLIKVFRPEKDQTILVSF